jgi:hypothetical protein
VRNKLIGAKYVMTNHEALAKRLKAQRQRQAKSRLELGGSPSVSLFSLERVVRLSGVVGVCACHLLGSFGGCDLADTRCQAR